MASKLVRDLPTDHNLAGLNRNGSLWKTLVEHPAEPVDDADAWRDLLLVDDEINLIWGYFFFGPFAFFEWFDRISFSRLVSHTVRIFDVFGHFQHKEAKINIRCTVRFAGQPNHHGLQLLLWAFFFFLLWFPPGSFYNLHTLWVHDCPSACPSMSKYTSVFEVILLEGLSPPNRSFWPSKMGSTWVA